TQLSEPFQSTKGRFYWLPGLRRSCFVVNQTMAAKASYQKANKIRSYGLIFRAVGINLSCRWYDRHVGDDKQKKTPEDCSPGVSFKSKYNSD
ncbi:MAG: hypothetical protein OIF56_09585, partial [Cohaesibacter sp.]|nr:hypothetical protein [Cohaesibacter sp.]